MHVKIKNFVGLLIGFIVGLLILFLLSTFHLYPEPFALSSKDMLLILISLIVGYALAAYVKIKR